MFAIEWRGNVVSKKQCEELADMLSMISLP
jgi:hypothetical protein